MPLYRLTLALLALVFMTAQVLAAGLDTRARAAMVIDYDTGAILFEKNADQELPPASMSKLMTLYMLFEALKNGNYQLSDTFPVSQRAQDMEGSTMFLDTTDKVSLEDLINGIIVQSGNDACVVVAEALAGSEAEFANRMTKRGREIGLTNSVFTNSTGWPHPDHKMTARDLVTLATALIRDFPEYYPYFAIQEYDFDGRAPSNRFNRNPLLSLGIGADGLKTGHTEEAGYGLVGSAVQDDRRVVFVVMGLASNRQRSEESERVVSWAFRDFSSTTVFNENEIVTQADVWLGATDTVGLVSNTPIDVLVPYSVKNEVDARAVFQGPIEAPIEKGQEVGELVVTIPGISDQTYPLFAAEDVPQGNFLKKMMASAMLLSQKIIDAAQSTNAE